MILAVLFMTIGCGRGTSEVKAPSSDKETVAETETETSGAETEKPLEQEAKQDESEHKENPVEEAVADSEEDLVALLSAKCQDTLMVIIVDDFDENGVNEAFAATSKAPNAIYFNDPDDYSDCFDDTTIWFITVENAVPIEDVPLGPNFVNMKSGTFVDGTKAVVVDTFMSNVDTDSYIFTVTNGNYNYLGTHISSVIAEDGLLYSNHFMRETGDVEVEVYEYSNGELILKEKYIDE